MLEKQDCSDVIITQSLGMFQPGPLTALLGCLEPHRFNDQTCRKAAVYAILDQNARLLVIQKPYYNDGYPWGGQIAFPGGHVETGDASFLDAALREVFEEVGIAQRQLHTIGTLGRFPTAQPVSIEAFIGFADKDVKPLPQAGEVDRIMWAELADLLQTHLLNRYSTGQITVSDLLYPVNNAVIWGATARIIQFLLNAVINNRNLCIGTAFAN